MLESNKSVIGQLNFKYYWAIKVLSSSSFQMLSVAIGWQMYELTHDAYSLGLVGLAQFLPMVLLTFVVGHVADRFDRRMIVAACQLTEGAVAVLLLLGSLAGWLGKVEIMAAAAILGACRAFEMPSFSALLPQLVPKELLQRAISWSTSAGQTAQIVGPALGGLLISAGPSYAYSTSAVALIAAGTLTLLIRMERMVRSVEKATLRSVFSGLEFIFRRPIILGTISLDLFAVLLGGATALLPIFASDILHTGPWGLGLLRTAPAVGALLTSIILARFPLERAVGLKLFGALAVFGLATMLFAVSTSLALSLFALLLIGGSDVVSVVIRTSLVQLHTPNEMQGRVNAVNSLFIGTSNQLGEFESGTLAGLMGTVPAAFIGGIGTLAVAGLWMVLFPSLRKMQRLTESK